MFDLTFYIIPKKRMDSDKPHWRREREGMKESLHTWKSQETCKLLGLDPVS
jgi:hypothetical protein